MRRTGGRRGYARGEPGVDQVEFVRREVEPLAAAAGHDEVAEAAGEQIGRGALLEPRVRLADDLEDEAHVVLADDEAEIVGAGDDVEQRLGADQIVVRDLRRHHLEQDAVLGRCERRRLAGFLDALDGALDRRQATGRCGWRSGCGHGHLRRRDGRARGGGLRHGHRRRRHFRRHGRGLQGRGRHRLRGCAGCHRERGNAGRHGGGFAHRQRRRGGGAFRLAVAARIVGDVGRLRGELQILGQARAEEFAEATRPGPAGADGLVVAERPHGTLRQRLERHGRRGAAHGCGDLGDDLAAHVFDARGGRGGGDGRLLRRALGDLSVEDQIDQVGLAHLAVADGGVGRCRVVVGEDHGAARVRAQAMQQRREVGVA